VFPQTDAQLYNCFVNIINFVGLILGFVGSVLLSVGLLKSKEAAVDEETPFWSKNPFKIRDVLTSRNFALWGLSLFVAGSATTTMVEFASIANIQTVFGVAMGSLALTFFGWLVIALIMQRKSSAHISHKNTHFRKVLKEQLVLQIKQLKDILSSPNPKSHDFNFIKYMDLEILIDFIPKIDSETQTKLEICLEEIKRSKELGDIRLAMEDCLTGLVSGKEDSQ